MRFAFALLLCALVARPLCAGDGVPSQGLLSDADLYRSMACGAAPNMACQGPFVRWKQPEVSVAFTCTAQDYPQTLAPAVKTALDQAITSLNAAESGLKLRRSNSSQADILVLCVNMAEGDLTKAIPNMTDGQSIGEAYTQINWGDDLGLSSATIVVSNSITAEVLPSVMLEELFQSLGFPYDVENPAYEGLSILSQTSDATTTIAGQDAAVLRLHYPAR